MRLILKTLASLLSHNMNHYITVEIGNTQSHLCTRCTGMIFGFLSTLPWVLAFDIYKYDSPLFAGIAISLALPDIIYWALTRTRYLPDYILIRVITGFLLGGGITIYGQVVLPWGFKFAIPLFLFLTLIIADRLIGNKTIQK